MPRDPKDVSANAIQRLNRRFDKAEEATEHLRTGGGGGGSPGPEGKEGKAGSKWYNGTGAPSGGTGVVGDYYLRTNGEVYEKTGVSTWTFVTSILGPEGPTGKEGKEGPTGKEGKEGPAGTSGAAGRDTGLNYLFSSNTENNSPAEKSFKFNSGVIGSIETLYIRSDKDVDNIKQKEYIESWDDSTTTPIKALLEVRERGEPANFVILKVESVGSELESKYIKVTCKALSNGGVLTNGKNYAFTFSRFGDKGATGPEGPTGASFMKAPVKVATTANITIATALNEGDSIDGISLVNGDRVLVKNQTTKKENGIYVAGVSPARATDADAAGELRGGTQVYVEQGSVAQADKIWAITTNGEITPGTTEHEWDTEKVAANEIASEAVTGPKIAAEAVTSGKLGTNAKELFLQLASAATRKVSFGSAEIEYKGGSVEASAAITHNLGTTPQIVIMEPEDAGYTTGTGEYGATTFKGKVQKRDGSSPASGVKAKIRFWAVG